ncbi:MAG: hypothetical protein ACO3AV_08315 [Ilumatobacteraceae bacterium]
MNDLFDDHIGDALHRAAADIPGRGPGFGDVRRRVRHRRRVQTGFAVVPVLAAGGLLALRHSPVAVPLTPGALGPGAAGDPTTSNPLSDCYVTPMSTAPLTTAPWTTIEMTTIDPRLLETTVLGYGTTTIPAASTILPEQVTSSIGGVTAVTVAGDPTSSLGDEPTWSTAIEPPTSPDGVAATTIPCESTSPIVDGGVLSTSTLPPCLDAAGQPAVGPDCGPVSAIPYPWSSSVGLAGTAFAISSLEADPDAICQYFDGVLSGCDTGFTGYGAILGVLRSADGTEVYVFGASAPGVRVIFNMPDGSVREAIYGDGDWRIAWAIALPTGPVEAGAVIGLYPEGPEPGTLGTPDTIAFDEVGGGRVEDLSVLEVPVSGSTTTPMWGGSTTTSIWWNVDEWNVDNQTPDTGPSNG